ncbi:MAG: AAA family ATPase [Proteobacteria bacterium]|nr:AAA family ATPase [Pseudomonadota bacterium]
MNEVHDLEVLLSAGAPVVVVETHEERRLVDIFRHIAIKLGLPVHQWAITEGLARIDIDYPADALSKDPETVVRQLKEHKGAGIYLFLDFHPYIKDPVILRTVREIAQSHSKLKKTIVFISHRFEVPAEIKRYVSHFELPLPSRESLKKLVSDEARKWAASNSGKRVKADQRSLDSLVSNVSGLSLDDARRLIRNAIYDDGVLSYSDIPELMEAKYQLLNTDAVLSYEYDTARFSEVGGLARLKDWLAKRENAFRADNPPDGLTKPKGMLLLGVQGCGKSLAARAVAGTWGVPLLGLDIGALYNKYIGETEKNIRQALKMANTMAPCVLWIDEIEKGISQGDSDNGTSKRILATLLTWMADDNNGVFIVATANDVTSLPPELLRKGRLDEIFFVDLPDQATRKTIFDVHLKKRKLDSNTFDVDQLAQVSKGFSGSEIEQAVVSAFYAAQTEGAQLDDRHVIDALRSTRPLSVVMAEDINALRQWASDRTVPAN